MDELAEAPGAFPPGVLGDESVFGFELLELEAGSKLLLPWAADTAGELDVSCFAPEEEESLDEEDEDDVPFAEEASLGEEEDDGAPLLEAASFPEDESLDDDEDDDDEEAVAFDAELEPSETFMANLWGRSAWRR